MWLNWHLWFAIDFWCQLSCTSVFIKDTPSSHKSIKECIDFNMLDRPFEESSQYVIYWGILLEVKVQPNRIAKGHTLQYCSNELLSNGTQAHLKKIILRKQEHTFFICWTRWTYFNLTNYVTMKICNYVITFKNKSEAGHKLLKFCPIPANSFRSTKVDCPIDFCEWSLSENCWHHLGSLTAGGASKKQYL